MQTRAFLAVVLISTCWCSGALSQVEVLTEGLQAPAKFAIASQEWLLVTETGTESNSGRISLVSRINGSIRPLISGLPSGVAANDQPSGPTDVYLRDENLQAFRVLIGAGDALQAGSEAGTWVRNPEGPASPILSSLLKIWLSRPLDEIQGSFTLTLEDHQRIADRGGLYVENEWNEVLSVSLWRDYRDVEARTPTLVRGSNPVGINDRLVADAGLSRIAKGGRFGSGSYPYPPFTEGTPVSIRPYCQGTSLVTLYPNSGAAQNTSAVANFNALDAVSGYRGYGYAPRVKVPETVYNPPRTLISGLTNAVDAIGLPRGCAYEGMLVLETSKDLSAQPPEPGRLLYFVDGESVVVADDIHSPVALAYAASRTIYISARNPGRILTIAFNSAWEERGSGQYR